jgi:4-amino-4-deoxy-L-arabinose transferase-like glycosyltransferase
VFLFDNNADLHYDMAMYRSYAEQYASTGVITEGADYAYRHSYMAFYGLILSPFAKLFGADTKVFTVLLSVLHSVAMVLLFDMLRHYVKKELAFVTMLLYCIFPLGLLQTQLLVHENALFFFHIAAFWLFERAFRKNTHWLKGLLLVFAAAVVLAMGKSVNAAGQVFFISFGIYAVGKVFSAKLTLKKCVSLVCVMAILVSCYVGSTAMIHSLEKNTLAVDKEDQSLNYSYPYGWSLYVGFNYDSAGSWTMEDNLLYHNYRTYDNKEDAIQYQKDLLKQRFQIYADDPIKIPVLLFKKIKNLWGNQLLPFAYEQGNAINDFVLHGMGGIFYKLCILVSKATSLLLFLMLLLAQWKKQKYSEDKIGPDLHFRMAVIGVTLALMLFEVTPKYASHLYICLFCALALMVRYYFADSASNK